MKQNKHEKLTGLLGMRLQQRHYVDNMDQQVEYALGEVDVWTTQGSREIYYEVKSNNTKKARKKARQQLRRWSGFCHRIVPSVNFYGVYYTPTKIKIMAKNGRVYGSK